MMLFICENVLLFVYAVRYGPFLCLLPQHVACPCICYLYYSTAGVPFGHGHPLLTTYQKQIPPTHILLTLTNQNTLRAHTNAYAFEPKNRTGFSNETIYAAVAIKQASKRKTIGADMGTTRGKERIPKQQHQQQQNEYTMWCGRVYILLVRVCGQN